MNVFLQSAIANNYDDYYLTGFGKQVDDVEKKILSSLLKDVPLGDILELGCGTGHWTDYLTGLGFKVKASDASEAMLRVAKNKKIKAEFLLVNSENLPFGDESCAGIVSITMLEFVDNPDRVVQEMHRVLKKEGWLILGCLNAKSMLGKNKDKDEVFKEANFFTLEEINDRFKQFELMEIQCGVYLTSDYSLVDDIQNTDNIEPVFLGMLFKKK